MPITKYWVTGNTAEGFVNFLEDNLQGVDQVISLKHPSATLKSKVLKNLMNDFDPENIEVLKSTLAETYLDGFIVRSKSLAIVDSTIAGSNTTETELDAHFPVEEQNLDEFHNLRQKAYSCYATGLSVHDELEEIYINQMDFGKADRFTANFISELLKHSPAKDDTGQIYHRLFGTNTADGTVNEVPHLIKNIGDVRYIKGRAGTGKSTFMKKVANACVEKGYDVELYHCSFDPNSADMILVRGMDFCIFDSTDPHEFFPQREGETIVDLYEELVEPGTDEKFGDDIFELNNRYKAFMKEGNRYIKEAGDLLEKLEQNYINTYSDKDIEKVSRNILNTI
ncbi:hypothetical protein ACFO3D_04950 [Virgibacillus kekensis]|uniref:ATPase n=1 Tax=Virgibacillus kekensis TaxID=202261 RepID=A0ABV9DII6_9BACI